MRVEEFHGAGLDVILGADDHQPVARDLPLEQLGAVSQLIDGRSNVGADRGGRQFGVVTCRRRAKQWLDRRPDAIDDRSQVRRTVATGAAQLFERGADGAALRVTEHDCQTRLESLGRELDAADLRGRDNVARDANDEQVAEALRKDELSGNARVGTSQDDGEGLLLSARPAGSPGAALDELPVPRAQPGECFSSRNHRRSDHAVRVGEWQPECLGYAGVDDFSFDDVEAEEQARVLLARSFPTEPRELLGVRERRVRQRER